MPRDTRLLYVEDDPVLRTMLSGVLAQIPGFEVVASVGTAEEALAVEGPLGRGALGLGSGARLPQRCRIGS
ncbi:MAG: hypothetical protein NT180_09690 [Actinobacteria bacterium]|nr:hypothetical protein [Actinomycetota bacterium]